MTSTSGSSSDPLRILNALARLEIQSPQHCRVDYLEKRRLEYAARGRSSYLNEIWRTKVCEWFYRIIDSHRANLSREIAHIAVNIVDRFLSKTCVDAEFDQEQSKSFFQLVTLTSLYIGVKAFYDRATVAAMSRGGCGSQDFLKEDNDVLTIQSLLRLSTAGIQADDIHVMTLNILTTLSWSIRPLSPLLFVRSMLAVVRCKQEDEHNGLIQRLYESCRFLCELSACDYFFVRYPSSSVALAAILVAIDQQQRLENQELLNQDDLLQDFPSIIGNDLKSTEIVLLRRRLEQIYARSAETSSDQHQEKASAAVIVVEQAYSDSIQRASSKRRRIVSSEDLTALWGQS